MSPDRRKPGCRLPWRLLTGLTVVASLGEAVASSLLFRKGREAFARRLDVACRVAFPLLFLLISTLSLKFL